MASSRVATGAKEDRHHIPAKARSLRLTSRLIALAKDDAALNAYEEDRCQPPGESRFHSLGSIRIVAFPARCRIS